MADAFLDFLSHLQQNFKNASPLGLEGTINAQTWNAASGTVHMVVGEGYTDCYNSSFAPYEIIGTLVTNKVGHQAGPWGGERAIAVPTRGGWRIFLTHGEDDNGVSDAPVVDGVTGAPSGEEWNLHAKSGTVGAENTEPPQWDAGWQLTNDGPATGDGLGGSHFGYQGALTNVNTKSGHVFSLNDTTQTVSTTTAGGMTDVFADVQQTITRSPGLATLFEQLDAANQTITHQGSASVYTLIDAANNVIDHVAPKVGIGSTFGSMAGTNNAINNGILQSFATNILQTVGNALQQVAQAAISASVPNAGAWLTAIQAGLPSLSFVNIGSTVASLTTPPGSSLVRIAS